MKTMLFTAILSLFFQKEHLYLRKDVLYICPILGNKFQIFQIKTDNAVVFKVYGKYPNMEYDFFERKNLDFIREDFKKESKTNRYTLKGDSLFIDRSDSYLTLKTFGILYKDKICMKTVYSFLNTSTNKHEVIKTEDDLVFKPY